MLDEQAEQVGAKTHEIARLARKVGGRSRHCLRGIWQYRRLKDNKDQVPSHDVVWIQYRPESVRIAPMFGKGALDAFPRVGHVQIHVGDLPWLWQDASGLNTFDMAGMPPGEHKVPVELVDANRGVFPGQAETVGFIAPKAASLSH